ncbi:hypothetical protein DMB42_52105 [Nonomuraea sp. WAC 01424]|uniref:hypothetical protein n=1 Tax=Nonomuraea sp. WAC 01424 TaxID=2203200 RepID=UPI000F780933|nr:hypothetical protein [Nonomuraea sp. WAC 01424]RSM93777.1 hypothetical protein DMB42_52105 [Nonomuraea sp. WAC 01424]
METFDVIVTARSNTELAPAQFDQQVAMLKQVLAWNGTTWGMRLSGSHTEHVGTVLTHLFEVARLYGPAITAQLVPAAQVDGTAVPG